MYIYNIHLEYIRIYSIYIYKCTYLRIVLPANFPRCGASRDPDTSAHSDQSLAV